MALLEVKNLTIKFGGLVALSNFNAEIEKNGLVGLIGPNGAGKTTVFNMLTGVYLPTEGDIKMNGKSIVGMKLVMGICEKIIVSAMVKLSPREHRRKSGQIRR
jgi:ABC-type multidrug transport system ATPase subunit